MGRTQREVVILIPLWLGRKRELQNHHSHSQIGQIHVLLSRWPSTIERFPCGVHALDCTTDALHSYFGLLIRLSVVLCDVRPD